MNTFPDPRTSRRFTVSSSATRWLGQTVELGMVPVLVLVALYLPLAYFVIPESNALHLSLFGINLIGQIMCFALLALALDLVSGTAYFSA
jgi:urea transport system permease protein